MEVSRLLLSIVAATAVLTVAACGEQRQPSKDANVANKSARPYTSQSAQAWTGTFRCGNRVDEYDIEYFPDGTFISQLEGKSPPIEGSARPLNFLVYGTFSVDGDRLYRLDKAIRWIEGVFLEPNDLQWQMERKQKKANRMGFVTHEFMIKSADATQHVLKPVRDVNWDGADVADRSNFPEQRCVPALIPRARLEAYRTEVPSYLAQPAASEAPRATSVGNQEQVQQARPRILCSDVKYGNEKYHERMQEIAKQSGLPDGYYSKYHEDVVANLCKGNQKEVNELIDSGFVKSSEVEAIRRVLVGSERSDIVVRSDRSEIGKSYGYSREKFSDLGLCSACADNIAQYYTRKPASQCGRLAKQALEGNPAAISELQTFPSYCKWEY